MLSLMMPIGALLTGVAILLLGTGLLNTLLALKSEAEGFGNFALGMIMSGYFAGFLVGTFLALPLIARIGHIRAFACCAALVAGTILLHVLIIDPIAWIAFRLLNGTALVILYTVIESWLNSQTPAETRARVFALYMTVNLCALAIAQQLLHLDSGLSHILFVVAALLVCISLVPVTLTRVRQPEVHSVARISPRALLGSAPAAVLGSLVSGLVMGAFWGLSASYASQVGFSVEQVGVFISCAIVGGALSQFPLGRFSDSRDRRWVLVGVATLAALSALALNFIAGNPWLMFAAIAVFGGMSFAIYPLSVAHMVDHVRVEDMLAGGSAMLLVHGIGAMLGPMLAGLMLQKLGTEGLPVYWLIINLCLVLAVGVIVRRGVAESAEDHAADFVPMIRTTPSALEMLPHEEAVTAPVDAERQMPAAAASDADTESPRAP